MGPRERGERANRRDERAEPRDDERADREGEFWKRHVERTRAELERGREIGCVRAGKDNARRERYTTPPGGDEDGSGESGATG